jgi:hypothetical protein
MARSFNKQINRSDRALRVRKARVASRPANSPAPPLWRRMTAA